MKGCHKHHGSFTDLRPWVGAWASPYLYGGEQGGEKTTQKVSKSYCGMAVRLKKRCETFVKF